MAKSNKVTMLETGVILKRLYERLVASAKNIAVADLRIGLGYAGVKLNNGAAGIAAVLFDDLPRGCTVMPKAGSFAGCPASDLLKFLIAGKNSLETALGLACANALIKPPEDSADDREATTYLDLAACEKVVMVGLFAPLVERIKATGAELTVIEKNPQRLETLSPEASRRALASCDVAIITATTLLNQTFEETVGALGKPRAAALLGPSTPLVADIFHDTPVTHLGGVAVVNSAKVLQIISEGGGTPALRPNLRFVNLIKR